MIRSFATLSPVLLGLLCFALLTHGAQAHTNLNSPNGGESFTPGQVVEIEWVVVASHNTVGWNLEYSLNGLSGPWVPIAMGLPPGQTFSGATHTYMWTLPMINAENVRVRVTQDNTGQDYMDESNFDFGIGSALGSDTFNISIASGGTQNLFIDAGPSASFFPFLTVGTTSGSQPGFDYAGFLVPINYDFYTDVTLQDTSLSPLQNGVGGLDANGQGTLQVVIAGGALPPSAQGLVLHHVVGILDFTGSVAFVTNAAPLVLIP